MIIKLKPFSLVPKHDWPRSKTGHVVPFEVYQSASYLVQLFNEAGGIIRMTVNSTKRRGNNWKDGITFDELQSIKSMVGYGEVCAVEVYPEESEFINDANMRHLWLLPERPNFAWKRKK